MNLESNNQIVHVGYCCLFQLAFSLFQSIRSVEDSSSKLKIVLQSRNCTDLSLFKSFSRSLEQVFDKVGQNNFQLCGNEIDMVIDFYVFTAMCFEWPYCTSLEGLIWTRIS